MESFHIVQPFNRWHSPISLPLNIKLATQSRRRHMDGFSLWATTLTTHRRPLSLWNMHTRHLCIYSWIHLIGLNMAEWNALNETHFTYEFYRWIRYDPVMVYRRFYFFYMWEIGKRAGDSLNCKLSTTAAVAVRLRNSDYSGKFSLLALYLTRPL